MAGFKQYFTDLQEGLLSSLQGLRLTWQHLWAARKKNNPIPVQSDLYFSQDTGIVTLEYPYEAIPVPDNGRYRLHNEIDDCIVCDKCAKICPVNCIDIVPIKSTEEIGLTSDGTSKRLYAATFDIDMAKCCYCGLCTTVCPTECLTMTPTFDYSEFDIRDMNYHFTDLSPEQAEEKQKLYDQKQAEKAAAKLAGTAQPVAQATNIQAPTINTSAETGDKPKPSFKPKFPVAKQANENPSTPIENTNTVEPSQKEEIPLPSLENKPQPIFRPKILTPKPSTEEPNADTEITSKDPTSPGTSPTEPINTSAITSSIEESKPKPVFRPKIPMPKKADIETDNPTPNTTSDIPLKTGDLLDENLENKTKPIFRPKIPMPKKASPEAESENPVPNGLSSSSENTQLITSDISPKTENPLEGTTESKPKPVFKPKMKPVIPPKKTDDSTPSPENQS